MFPQRLRVRFRGSRGAELAARLDLPVSPPRAYAVFAHCFTCNKDLKAVNWMGRELVDQRVAFLRFDFTGLGESGGDFAETNFTSNLADLVAAADFLRANYRAPALLIGHSLGGTAALAAAADIPEVRAVATIAAPSGTGPLHEFLTRQAPSLTSEESAHIEVMGRTIRIKGQLLEDLRKYDVLGAVRRLGRPLLIFHSPTDEVVEVEHARRIFDAAQQPKSFIALDGADHLLVARESDARYVAGVLAAWARRYVDE